MSLKLMVRVMEGIDVTRPQQAVLMAMAEHANDDGTRCFPSVDLIAWKAGYKPRNVVDIIRELRKSGVIEEVAPATGTRPTEYALHLDQAPKKLTFEDWQRVNGRHRERYVGVQSHENDNQVGVQSHDFGVQNGEIRGAVSRESGVQSRGEGCNLAGGGVHSHEKTARENAPRTVSEPSETEGVGGVVGTTRPESPDDPAPPTTNFLPHPIFDDWQPDEHLIREIEQTGIPRADILRQVPNFVDHNLGKGTIQVDWRAVFRKWMRNAVEFGYIGPNARQPRGAPRNAKVNAQTDEQFWEGIEFVRDAQEARYRAASEDEDKDNATTHQPGTPARD